MSPEFPPDMLGRIVVTLDVEDRFIETVAAGAFLRLVESLQHDGVVLTWASLEITGELTTCVKRRPEHHHRHHGHER